MKTYVERTMDDRTKSRKQDDRVQNMGITFGLDANLGDATFNSVGIYSSDDINENKYKKYSRFGRVLDPHNKLNDTREYLFFVKPDLHICYNEHATNIYGKLDKSESFSANGLTLNPQLQDNPYFVWLISKRPEVAKQLQFSLNKSDPFCNLLSFTVNNSLDLPSVDSSTLDTPNTIFGSNIEYLKDSETSDENRDFSLEFVDSKKLEVYHFFKAYSEYHKVRKSGLVTPPDPVYYQYKMLHNIMGVFKFLVDEDMETIRYYAYYWGVFPTNVPREAFSDPSFDNGLSFSINFKSAFIEDNDPRILLHFNDLMTKRIGVVDLAKKDWMPIVKQNFVKGVSNYEPSLDTLRQDNVTSGGTALINGELARGAYVDMRGGGEFKLRWYK
nr:MAG TPA: hypothetical protein [Caudoviricetes sp.]